MLMALYPPHAAVESPVHRLENWAPQTVLVVAVANSAAVPQKHCPKEYQRHIGKRE